MKRAPHAAARLLQRTFSEYLHQTWPTETTGYLITITLVEVSDNLENAYIHLSMLGKQEKKEQKQKVIDNIAANRSTIKKYLAKKLRKRLRVLPEIHFHLDESAAQNVVLARLIEKL